MPLGYTARPFLENVDIVVNPGEVVALSGRNGIGKSSTAMTASGRVKPRAGSVALLGELVDFARTHLNVRRGLAHVPEGRCLFTKLSVADNLRRGMEP